MPFAPLMAPGRLLHRAGGHSSSDSTSQAFAQDWGRFPSMFYVPGRLLHRTGADAFWWYQIDCSRGLRPLPTDGARQVVRRVTFVRKRKFKKSVRQSDRFTSCNALNYQKKKQENRGRPDYEERKWLLNMVFPRQDLRWLTTASRNFQYWHFDWSTLPLFIN